MRKNTKTVPIGLKLKYWPMEQHQEKFWGILCGITGGMGKYFLQINNASFIEKLIGAGLTAVICGFLGAAGKHLYDFIRLKIKKRNHERND